MRYLTIILSIIILSSCSGLRSKEHRRKRKCNRKLERVIRKCPELLNQDTIRDTVVFNIPEVRIDSFISIERDTAVIDSLLGLIRNKKAKAAVKEFFTKYVPIKDTIIHEIDGYTFRFFNSGGNIGYSVKRPEKVVEIPTETIIDVVKPVELTTGQKIIDFIWQFWWLILIGILSFIFLIWIIRRLFPKKD